MPNRRPLTASRLDARPSLATGRRAILSAAGATAVALALPALGGCSSQLRAVVWDGPRPQLDDERLRLLSYAVLAPNAHNTQPWLLDLRRPGEVDLYVDPTRLLPETDPPARQIHISHGTFLEVLDIAAREGGAAPAITLFPKGEYGPESLEDRPTATVRFEPAARAARDPLFSQITRRISNRRVYDAHRPLSADQIRALTQAPAQAAEGDGPSFVVVQDATMRAALTAMMGEAMAIEASARARNEETARWWRFDDAELAAKRDGFGLRNGGTSGFGRWFIESFVLRRKSAGDPDGAFARGAVERARAQADSVSAVGLLVTRGNTRKDQLMAGRAYARVALTGTAQGVAMHPMTQSTEEYGDMAALKRRFLDACGVSPSQTLQMVVRLGFAAPHDHTPRRDPQAMTR
jgi:hypothetical protein